jgi:hypothetical protein
VTDECRGCGDPLTTNYDKAREFCDWCDAERRAAFYDEDDEADMVLGQELDEVDRG